MEKKFVIIIALVSLSAMGFASSMEPTLWTISVWEYYKFEKGVFRNYAVVINPLDTDADIFLVKNHGYYFARPKYIGQKVGRDTSNDDITVEVDKINLNIEEIARQGKPIIHKGDTLSHLKLKKHEIRIIADFFEVYRKAKIPDIRMMVNGINGGVYTLYQYTLPKNLNSTCIISFLAENTGDVLPITTVFTNAIFTKNKQYNIKVQVNSPSYDTVLIYSPSSGSRYHQLAAMDIKYCDKEDFFKNYEPNSEVKIP